MVLKAAEFPPKLPPDFAGIPLNGGRTQAITVNPRDRRNVIVSMQFGGLWRTHDGGRSWQHLRRLPATFSHDVQFGADGRTVVATTSYDNAVRPEGVIWVSHDGGSTWARPPSALVPRDARTPIDVSAWGVTTAPEREGEWHVGTDYGLASSFDYGSTWTHARVAPTSPLAAGMTQDAVRSVLAFPGRSLLAMTDSGIHRSDDSAATWRTVRSESFLAFNWAGWNKMDRSPYWPYAFIFRDYETLLLYELGSERWTTLTMPPGGSRGPFVRVAKSYMGAGFITIYVGHGVDALSATAKRIGAMRAIRASSWTSFGRATGVHDDMGDLGVDADGKPTMIGSDGGVFAPAVASVIGEITKWRSSAGPGSGMNSYQITDLAGTNYSARGSGPDLYFSTQDNGLWGSTDGGVSWPGMATAEGFHLEAPFSAAESTNVTVAYGSVGGGYGIRFADSGLSNQRDVPKVDLNGNELGGWFQAFYVVKDHWIRLRMPSPGSDGVVPPAEVWVSSDDGDHWKKRFDLTVGPAGVIQRSKTNYPAGYAKAYLPVGTGVVNPDGSGQIGLLRLYNLYRNGVDAIGGAAVLRLPGNGSLGVRATEFDWQAVFGVHPYDWRHIIAPDIVAGDVKVSRDGGATWSTDAALTDLVTHSGAVAMYKDPYRFQVTHISFDPRSDRIAVGTRDSGVFLSHDGGATWSSVFKSARMRYVTGFFFAADGGIIVSTYGRGLWKIAEGGAISISEILTEFA